MSIIIRCSGRTWARVFLYILEEKIISEQMLFLAEMNKIVEEGISTDRNGISDLILM